MCGALVSLHCICVYVGVLSLEIMAHRVLEQQMLTADDNIVCNELLTTVLKYCTTMELTKVY